MFAPSTAVRRGFACALAAVLLTSGCAAGRDAQTQHQIPTQDGTNADVGTMALRGIALESPSSGAGFAPGSMIPMRLVLVNNGNSDDTLTNITTSAARGWAGYRTAAQASAAASQASSSTAPSVTTTPTTASSSTSSAPGSAPVSSTAASSARASSTPTSAGVPAQTSVRLPANQRVSFGVPDSSRVLVLTSSVGRIYPGTSVKVTFTFSKAGSVTTTVPVQLTSDTPGVGRNS